MFRNAKFSGNQTWENIFRYEAPKLWNMLENKFRNLIDLDSFKESIHLWAAQDVCVPIAHNVFCIIKYTVLYMQCCSYVTTSSRFIVFRFISLPLIIHLHPVAE